jgi:cytoskeleton protein RodZ
VGFARKNEGEAMDEELVEPEVPTAGERLRAAREAKGLTLEDVAAQTRIPQRHLESIETGDWAKLPAPTYTIGFARNYATAVGLDTTEVADQLRGELGGARPTTTTEVFEPADPRRTMPKSLVFGAIAAVIVIVIVMSWLNRRSLEQPDDAANNVEAAASPSAPAPAPVSQAAPASAQQVTLTATNAVWIQVSEKGGATIYTGTLQPGQTYVVPGTATAPMLRTGMPEALRVTVGTTVAPPLGPPATTVNVSLLPADLLKTGQPAAAPAPASPPAAASAPKPRRARATAPAPTPAPTTPPPQPSTTNTGE